MCEGWTKTLEKHISQQYKVRGSAPRMPDVSFLHHELDIWSAKCVRNLMTSRYRVRFFHGFQRKPTLRRVIRCTHVWMIAIHQHRVGKYCVFSYMTFFRSFESQL